MRPRLSLFYDSQKVSLIAIAVLIEKKTSVTCKLTGDRARAQVLRHDSVGTNQDG